MHVVLIDRADLKHTLGCHIANLAIGGQCSHHPIVAQQVLLTNIALKVDI